MSTDSGMGESSVSDQQVAAPAQDKGAQDNPAWKPFLNELPEYFHPKAREHFSKWDENYRNLETQHRELSERYKPYEQYLNVDPGILQNGLNVVNAINTDPMRVYELLTETLMQRGMLQEQQDFEGEEQEEADPYFQELDQRTQHLDERQQQIDAYIQEQMYEQQVNGFEGEIDSQVQAVMQKYGEAVDTEDLLQRMYVQVQQGKNFDAETAFQEQKATFKRLYDRLNTNSRPAPRVIPTNGTPAPSGEKSPAQMNEAERKAYFKQLLDMANAGG